MAANTVNATCDVEGFEWSEFCCGPQGGGYEFCETTPIDSALYSAQAKLYADTLGLRQGRAIQSPYRWEHGFPYTAEGIAWAGPLIAEAAVELLAPTY